MFVLDVIDILLRIVTFKTYMLMVLVRGSFNDIVILIEYCASMFLMRAFDCQGHFLDVQLMSWYVSSIHKMSHLWSLQMLDAFAIIPMPS